MRDEQEQVFSARTAGMVLSVLVLANEHRAWLPAAALASTMVPYAAGALAAGALSWLLPRRWYLWLDNRMYELFMNSCLFVFETCNGTQVSAEHLPAALPPSAAPLRRRGRPARPLRLGRPLLQPPERR